MHEVHHTAERAVLDVNETFLSIVWEWKNFIRRETIVDLASEDLNTWIEYVIKKSKMTNASRLIWLFINGIRFLNRECVSSRISLILLYSTRCCVRQRVLSLVEHWWHIIEFQARRDYLISSTSSGNRNSLAFGSCFHLFSPCACRVISFLSRSLIDFFSPANLLYVMIRERERERWRRTKHGRWRFSSLASREQTSNPVLSTRDKHIFETFDCVDASISCRFSIECKTRHRLLVNQRAEEHGRKRTITAYHRRHRQQEKRDALSLNEPPFVEI